MQVIDYFQDKDYKIVQTEDSRWAIYYNGSQCLDYLEQTGLGRLYDTVPEAVEALEQSSSFDIYAGYYRGHGVISDLLKIFDNKQVGDIPAPFYLDQQQADQLSTMLTAHTLMVRMLEYIVEWKDFPPEERKISAPHGPKAQIEHVRARAKQVLEFANYWKDK